MLSTPRIAFLFCLMFASAIRGQTDVNQKEVDRLNREGIQLARDGKHDAALRNFEQAASLQEHSSARTFHNMGYAWELKGDQLKAVESYQKAVDRDPGLVAPRQNLGRLLYYGGQYKEAVLQGETVMKLDPGNKEVPKWLPDAYRKLTEQRLAVQSEEKKPEKKKEEEKPEDPEKFTTELTYTVSNYHHFNKEKNEIVHFTHPGFLKIPMEFNALFLASEKLHIVLNFESPYMGPAMPATLIGRERMEFQFWGKKFFGGFGLLFTQANLSGAVVPRRDGDVSFRLNSDVSDISDTKFGGIFGYHNENGVLTLGIFPRYLVKDAASGPQNSVLDASRISFSYDRRPVIFGSKKTGKKLPIFWGLDIEMNEAYITEYKTPATGNNYGHYFGTYDFSFRLEFGDIEKKKGTPVTFGLIWTERLYFLDLNEESYESFGNGQGFFGFDSKGALEGNSFSGFYSNSHKLTLFSRQKLFQTVLLREALSYEFTLPAVSYNAIGASVSVGMRF